MNSYRLYCPHYGSVIDVYLSNNNANMSFMCQGRQEVIWAPGNEVHGDPAHKMTKMRMVGYPPSSRP